MASLFTCLGWAFCAVAVVGAGYTLLSAWLVGRFMRGEPKPDAPAPNVTILKPLHQCEPDLARNLETLALAP